MKFNSVYHSIEKVEGGKYIGKYEINSKFISLRKRSRTIHHIQGNPVYIFASIFSPADINTKIYHEWGYFDKNKSGWVNTDKIPIEITGGRNNGFRGYSKKYNIQEGRWRVNIKTERGQIIGRVRFKVIEVEKFTDLEIEIL